MEEKKEKKKILIVIPIILVSLLIIIFLVNKLLSSSKEIVQNEQVAATHTEEKYEHFATVANDYLAYTSVDVISGLFLKNIGLVNSEYDFYLYQVIEKTGSQYTDIETSEKVAETATLSIRNYLDGENVVYSEYVTNNHTMKFELLNKEDEDFMGIYNELDELLFESKELKVSELEEGNYRYYYNNEYIEFRIYIDNDKPILDSYEISGNFIAVNYDDISNYEVYYYFTEEQNSTNDLSSFKIRDNINLNCGVEYNTYVYAEDEAGNKSGIENIGTYILSCDTYNEEE
ncbi:MAG: hypothetical protein R3Y13_01520 [bacterium]